MYTYDEIVLNPQENFVLFLMSYKKTLKLNYDNISKSHLHRYGIIRLNTTSEYQKDGLPTYDGTYTLTDFGKRYKIYCRRERRHRYLTPIVVAFLTTLATRLLEMLLLPGLSNWLQDLF